MFKVELIDPKVLPLRKQPPSFTSNTTITVPVAQKGVLQTLRCSLSLPSSLFSPPPLVRVSVVDFETGGKVKIYKALKLRERKELKEELEFGNLSKEIFHPNTPKTFQFGIEGGGSRMGNCKAARIVVELVVGKGGRRKGEEGETGKVVEVAKSGKCLLVGRKSKDVSMGNWKKKGMGKSGWGLFEYQSNHQPIEPERAPESPHHSNNSERLNNPFLLHQLESNQEKAPPNSHPNKNQLRNNDSPPEFLSHPPQLEHGRELENCSHSNNSQHSNNCHSLPGFLPHPPQPEHGREPENCYHSNNSQYSNNCHSPPGSLPHPPQPTPENCSSSNNRQHSNNYHSPPQPESGFIPHSPESEHERAPENHHLNNGQLLNDCPSPSQPHPSNVEHERASENSQFSKNGQQWNGYYQVQVDGQFFQPEEGRFSPRRRFLADDIYCNGQSGCLSQEDEDMVAPISSLMRNDQSQHLEAKESSSSPSLHRLLSD